MDSRKLARETLAGLLDDISTFVAVYDHLATSFDGVTPVAMVESFGTVWVNSNFGSHERAQRMLIHIWWAWTDANEDRVDDLSAEVFDKLEANQQVSSVWDSLMIDDFGSTLTFSEPDEDGRIYRIETIPVIVW